MVATQVHSLERLEGLTVADVMSRDVATIPADALMDEAATRLHGRGVSGAPVVDDMGRCIGVVSAIDFLRFEECAVQPSEDASYGRDSQRRGNLPWNSVQRYMSSPPWTIEPTAPLMHAAEAMCTRHIHRLIVLDEHESPLGVISTFDVLSATLQAVDEERQARGRRDRRVRK